MCATVLTPVKCVICCSHGVFFTGGGRAGKTQKLAHMKTYIAPWEKAMKGDESLIATLKTAMPGPIQQRDVPKYKCFNRYFPQGLTLYVLCDKQGLWQSSHLALLGLPCPSAASRRPTSSWNSSCQKLRRSNRSLNHQWCTNRTSTAGLPSTALLLAGWAAVSPAAFTWRRMLCPSMERPTSCEKVFIPWLHSLCTYTNTHASMYVCIHVSMHKHHRRAYN